MKFSLRLVFILIWLALGINTQAQDSLDVFSLEKFYQVVLNHHPVVKQARLFDDVARQELRYARGFFDPKIESTFDAKEFQRKNYFQMWDNVLKVPVWFNTDLKVGYERNTGLFLNDENSLPENGLIYAGVSLPIGQGLFIDQRRAAVKQAEIYGDIADAEKIKLINKLLLQATKDYLNWHLSYNDYLLMDEAVRLATVRYNAIKQNVTMGDYAPIDSVEAKIIVQNRTIERRQSFLEFQNAGLLLSTHLWNQDGVPLEIRENAIPQIENALVSRYADKDLNYLMAQIAGRHPEIRKIEGKIKQLQVERRLNIENLKPEINLNYNFLNQPGNDSFDSNGSLFTNDYKLGVDFAFPLFLRKERAKLQKTEIKLLQNNYEQSNLSVQLRNEVESFYNEMQNLSEIIDLQEQMVSNYQRLLSAEILNFTNGQSSLFLVNSRESKLIESRQKLLSLQVKYQKSIVNLLWSAGILYPEIAN
ncbi:MAG: TolC family protein [Candidatus Cyclobacteriaceae bacterium M3_2C_046]